MIRISYHVAPSRIPQAGQGLFTSQAVKAGSVIIAPSHIDKTVSLGELLATPDHPLGYCSVRWFEDQCTVSPDWPDECYVNHSFDPSGIWHLGFIFAIRDLELGEEIHVNYQHLLGPGVEMDFNDSVTGNPIVGYDWEESLKVSANQLLATLA